MYNRRTARLGNDGGFDNIRLLDITPSLSKAFSPNLLSAGGGLVKLVFTVTNRSDLYAKPGWQFTDNLSVNFDAMNLLNQKYFQYQNVDTMPVNKYTTGRRYGTTRTRSATVTAPAAALGTGPAKPAKGAKP